MVWDKKEKRLDIYQHKFKATVKRNMEICLKKARSMLIKISTAATGQEIKNLKFFFNDLTCDCSCWNMLIRISMTVSDTAVPRLKNNFLRNKSNIFYQQSFTINISGLYVKVFKVYKKTTPFIYSFNDKTVWSPLQQEDAVVLWQCEINNHFKVPEKITQKHIQLR